MGRKILRVLCVLAMAGTSALVALPASADGSRNLHPSDATCQANSLGGSCRASLEWRTNTYGPPGSQIMRRTLLNVYARAGEVLEMGSSAVGVGSGDVVVWNPGQISDQQAATLPAMTSGVNGFACSAQRTATGVAAQGKITSRALELAGPQSADGTGNTAGYVPCTYTAPTTGIYQVAFYGTAGANAATDGGPTGDITMAAATNFSTTQGTSISAWDLTVRADNASTTSIPGRIFTYALAEFTGGNGRPIFQSLYVTTDDGYEYRVDTRGMDPNGFIMFGSRTGFLDPNGDPLDHDVTGNAGGSAMSGLDGGTGIAPPEFPLSFAPLAPETLTALSIPSSPTAPQVSALTFDGNIAANNSTVSGGGVFHYTANEAGNYQIVVSRDGVNYDPGNPSNKVLLGLGAAGANDITWDGLDNSGTPFPPGSDYPFTLGLHAGEYHFPELDAESSTLGGPTFTLMNPPGGNCPFGRPSCTTAFYDDRGYTTSTGTNVGPPGALLCGTNPPATSHSDPITGFDSSGSQRAFGVDTGGNTNASCTGAFGDVKGLDTWTYYPSNTKSNTLNVVASPPAGPTATDDSGTTPAGVALNAAAPAVLGNDTGTGLTVTSNTAPANGSATVNADGSYRYTPDAGFSGVDSFDYTVTDGLGRTATATVTVTVTPRARPDTFTTVAGTPVAVDPTANDLGSGLAVTSVGQPSGGEGTTSISGGQVVFTPSAGFTGPVTVPYTVTDALGSTSSSTITFTVDPPAPVLADDSGTTPVGTALTVAAPGVLSNDNGTGLTVTGHTSPAHGTVSGPADGSYIYTPAGGYSGPDSFGYTVTDGLGRTATATVRITVTPVAVPDAVPVVMNQPATVDPTSNDQGTGLSVTSVGQPPAGQGSTAVVGGSVVYTPPIGFIGTVTVPYIVTDATGGTASSTLTYTVTPPAPTAADDNATTAAGGTLSMAASVLGNDTGNAISVTGSTTPGHGSATVNPDGTYTYVPAGGFSGVDTFDYTITDSQGRTATATVTVTVTPAAVPDAYGTLAATPVTVDPTANDVGSGLTVTAVGQPPGGEGTTGLSGGQVVFTPTAGFTGTVTVPYTVTDAAGDSDSSTITFTVDPPAPTAVDDAGTTSAGTPLDVVAPGVLSNDNGTGIGVSGHTSPAHGVVTVAADGSYAYTSAAGYSGPDSFGYTVTDGLGRTASAVVRITVSPVAAPDAVAVVMDNPATVDPTLNDTGTGLSVISVGQPAAGQGGTALVGGSVVYTPPIGFTGTVTVPYTVTDAAGGTASSTVTFTVSPLAPTAADDDATTAAGVTLTMTSGVLGNDTGNAITVTANTSPPHGSATVDPDGTYTYVPDAGFSGVDTFGYTITDSQARTATATVTITVTPTASPDTATTAAGVPVTIDPTLNDLGLGLTVTSVGQPAGGEGTTSLTGGQVRFTPAAGFAGSVTVPYTVTDSTGNSASSTITVTVDPLAPTAADDTGTTRVNTPLTVTAPGVLSNDNGTSIGVTAHTAPSHGTVALNADGSYTYTPGAGYSGPDTFDYTVTDGLGRTAVATVRITVTPRAADDTARTPYDVPVTVPVLGNDAGSQLSVTAVTQPASGTVAFSGTDVTYTPPPGFAGPATFTYTVTDAAGQTVTATVRVTVGPPASSTPGSVTSPSSSPHGGSGPGGSGHGGSGHGSTSHGGSGHGSTSHGGSGSDPSGGTSGDRLPFTGIELGLALRLVFALVGAGVLLRLAGRRRTSGQRTDR